MKTFGIQFPKLEDFQIKSPVITEDEGEDLYNAIMNQQVGMLTSSPHLLDLIYTDLLFNRLIPDSVKLTADLYEFSVSYVEEPTILDDRYKSTISVLESAFDDKYAFLEMITSKLKTIHLKSYMLAVVNSLYPMVTQLLSDTNYIVSLRIFSNDDWRLSFRTEFHAIVIPIKFGDTYQNYSLNPQNGESLITHYNVIDELSEYTNSMKSSIRIPIK